MCIIQGSTRKVGDTEIMAFRTRDEKSQVTIYSNCVELPPMADKDTAMILPVPGASRLLMS